MKGYEWIDKIIEHPNWVNTSIDWEAVDELKELLNELEFIPLVSYDQSLGVVISCPHCKKRLDNKSYETSICSNCGGTLKF